MTAGATSTAEASLLARVDELVAANHLLSHPFYQAWTAGALSRERLRDYAVQYHHHVAAFPRYLSALHSRCSDLATRQALLENLIEEERGARNHPELWLSFADSLGVTRDQVLNTPPRATTRQLVDTYHRLTREAPLAGGLAALYVYESQIPAVATAKISGLKRYYGVTDEAGLAFFAVHREADEVHSRVCAQLIEQNATDSVGADAVLAAAEQSLTALWTMLDGVNG